MEEHMLYKEERDKVEIPPIIYLCYSFVLPIRQDRLVAQDGNYFVLIDIDGHEICRYDSIHVPRYTIEDPDFEYKAFSIEDLNKAKQAQQNSDESVDSENDQYNERKYPFVEDYLIVRRDNKLGVIDYDGNVLLEPEYRQIEFRKNSNGQTEADYMV